MNIRKEAAQKRRALVDERDSRVKEITRVWKEGFGRLKYENDFMQQELENWYHTEQTEIIAWMNGKLLAGPPK
jgi:hypothetical protein